MALNFADLKKSSLDKLSQQLTQINKPFTNNEDNRFWYPEVDKAGNGYAVIRFLPEPPNEDAPFVRWWEHSFKGPGGWYIEKCLSSIDKPDPVMEMNNTLWNSGKESDKQKARDQKRKLYFASNILVLKDPAKPENEGKVFLFRYGKKIYDKINELMFPPEGSGEPQVNVFDLHAGAKFTMKIRKGDNGFRNYDASVFSSPSPLSDDDEFLEGIWKQEHSLASLVDPKVFKDYDYLKARMTKVLGAQAIVAPKVVGGKDHEDQEDSPVYKSDDNKEDDDRMKFFKELQNDD